MIPIDNQLDKMDLIMVSPDKTICIMPRDDYDRVFKNGHFKLVSTSTDKMDGLHYHVSEKISYNMELVHAVEETLVWFDDYPDRDDPMDTTGGLVQYVEGGTLLPLFLVGERYVGVVAPRLE